MIKRKQKDGGSREDMDACTCVCMFVCDSEKRQSSGIGHLAKDGGTLFFSRNTLRHNNMYFNQNSIIRAAIRIKESHQHFNLSDKCTTFWSIDNGLVCHHAVMSIKAFRVSFLFLCFHKTACLDSWNHSCSRGQRNNFIVSYLMKDSQSLGLLTVGSFSLWPVPQLINLKNKHFETIALLFVHVFIVRSWRLQPVSSI